MKKFFRAVRLPVFFLGLLLTLSLVLGLFTVSDTRGYQTFQAFFDNKDIPLDAVYVGSSTTYAFWQAPFSWEKFGFAVYPLAFPSLSCRSLKYVIEEGRKTQPDALYIINLNTFKLTESNVARIHYVADYMPLSANKIAMIRELSKAIDMTGFSALEFYLPFIRFHSGWDELSSERVTMAPEGVQGGVHYKSFLSKTTDVTDKYLMTDERGELTEDQDEILADLLRYCGEEKVNALFVVVPQPDSTEQQLCQLNTIMDVVSEAGYPVLDLSQSVDEIGLDTRYDFYNPSHVNIHGCVKYMDRMGEYLRDAYGFTDKRGDPVYAAWDQAVEDYEKVIAPYALDFEHSDAGRDYSLPRLKLSGADVKDGAVTFTWEAPEDGGVSAVIYRKTGKGAWQRLAEVDAAAGGYVDDSVKAGKSYTYTAVPVRYENDAPFYGDYDYSGIGVKVEKSG